MTTAEESSSLIGDLAFLRLAQCVPSGCHGNERVGHSVENIALNERERLGGLSLRHACLIATAMGRVMELEGSPAKFILPWENTRASDHVKP